MSRGNGGYIGIKNITSTAYANGKLSLFEQYFEGVNQSFPIEGIPAEVLIVAGGGGGGQVIGGGGGGGGVLHANVYMIPVGTHTVTIGAGGIGNSDNANGSNTLLTVSSGESFISRGGGGSRSYTETNNGSPGHLGGSGGGGGGTRNGTSPGGATIQISNNIAFRAWGNTGGFGTSTGDPIQAGGGGGANLAGQPGQQSPAKGGDGGAGKLFTTDGTSAYYAGGGGGNGYISGGGSGGLGGGGPQGVAGTVNTGGGGGGGSFPSGGSGAGGSGIVIIKYPDAFPELTNVVGSQPMSLSGGFRIYKFTGSGSFKV